MDSDRLKHGTFLTDKYFDEQLERETVTVNFSKAWRLFDL